jgi:hypothetical protein
LTNSEQTREGRAPPPRIAVIVDNGRVPLFALHAIDAIEGCDEISIFSCTNTSVRRKVVRHGAYYLLNLFSVRNPLTRPVSVADSRKRIARRVNFHSDYQGAWQKLPLEVVEAMRGFDVVLKFGMGLLRVPAEDRLPVPILSYHHGDPDHFRGRPAGFWETVERTPVMGQMIQRIGNRLDAGQIAAFAETKIYPHSYRRTLIEAYSHSSLLINTAIRKALAKQWLAKPCTGRNYRLPSNLQVAAFVTRMAFEYAKRLFYGAFVEKKWRVFVAPLDDLAQVAKGATFPDRSLWRPIETGKGYAFYADPFYAPDGRGILVEALGARSGKGEIVRITGSAHECVLKIDGHLSYPAAIAVQGKPIVLPEMAINSEQTVYLDEGGSLQPLHVLRLDRPTRLVDPTLFEHRDRLYLFANRLQHGSSALFLWSARSLSDVFTLHPRSPLLISPRGGRMAGNLLLSDRRILRFGQTFLTGYGDGIVCYEIEELGPDTYREREIGELRFLDPRGPHTINFRNREVLFDCYEERVSLAAGLRRLRARYSAG